MHRTVDTIETGRSFRPLSSLLSLVGFVVVLLLVDTLLLKGDVIHEDVVEVEHYSTTQFFVGKGNGKHVIDIYTEEKLALQFELEAPGGAKSQGVTETAPADGTRSVAFLPEKDGAYKVTVGIVQTPETSEPLRARVIVYINDKRFYRYNGIADAKFW